MGKNGREVQNCLTDPLMIQFSIENTKNGVKTSILN